MHLSAINHTAPRTAGQSCDIEVELQASRDRVRRLEAALRTVLRTLETPNEAIVDVVWAEGELCTTLHEHCEWALERSEGGVDQDPQQIVLPGVIEDSGVHVGYLV